MPVRARRNKRKASADLAAWLDVFESEFDYFGDLADAGIETDAYGRPDLEEAREAWARLGGEFMEEHARRYPKGAHFTPWAVVQFGEPKRRPGHAR